MKKQLLHSNLISLASIMVLFLISGNNLFAQVSDVDKAILMDLYIATDGDNWIDKTNWGTTEPVSTWYGITVELDNVTGIELDKNNLVGSIPASLGGLTSLEILDLDTNQIAGTIPIELGNLTLLEELYLDGNNLTGSIPDELVNLTNLNSLYLCDNQLSGTIPAFTNLTNLQYFDLSHNQLTGSIPVELASLTNLNFLDLGNNLLTGSIPAILDQLTNLIWLDLRSNQFSGLIPNFAVMPNLRMLYLNSNNLTGTIPAGIGQQTSLVWLHLGQNQLTGIIPVELNQLVDLEQLYLDGNQLSGAIPTELGALTNLIWMNLSQNELTGSIPVTFSSLTSLELMYLDNNQLDGSIPAELGLMLNLHWVFLNNNLFSGTIPGELGNLANLEWLRLNNNQLTGSVPIEITQLANLLQLYLNENQLDFLPEYNTTNSLTDLYVFDNKLTFEDLEYNMAVLSGINFTYSPQDSIGVSQTFAKNEGETLTYTLTTGGTANSFQWYKDGGVLGTQTSATLEITNLTDADAGNYYCEVTNTLVSGLTLTSREVTLLLNKDFELSLIEGWNIFSSPVMPDNRDLKDILQPLIDLDVLLKVMNEKGQVIEERESGWINNINDIESTEGYKIKVSANATLDLTGISAELPFDIALISGWNIISWPSFTAQDGLDAFDELITGGQLIKVMNEQGQAIEDRGDIEWFNGIGNLMPGEGYKIKVSEDCTLTVNDNVLKSEEIKAETIASTHFVPAYIGNGTDHMNIYLMNSAELGIMEGDEIGIFDGNICVGSTKIAMLNSSIINLVASASEDNLNANGFNTGNDIQLKLFRNGEEYPLAMSAMNNSSNKFVRNGTTFVMASADINTGIVLTDDAVDFLCYPNPFSEILNIEINLQQRKELTVEIYDLLSRRVRVLYKGSAEGKMKLQWDANDSQGKRIAPGVYVCRVNGIWKKIVMN